TAASSARARLIPPGRIIWPKPGTNLLFLPKMLRKSDIFFSSGDMPPRSTRYSISDQVPGSRARAPRLALGPTAVVVISDSGIGASGAFGAGPGLNSAASLTDGAGGAGGALLLPGPRISALSVR